jgi:hypothetical protein
MRQSVCMLRTVDYDWCTIPESGYDALLFPAIAVVLACLLQGRMSTTLVLIIGAGAF